MDVSEQIGIGFGQQESGERGHLRIVEAVVRHRGLRVVGARIAQPRLQPLRFDLAPHPSQLGANVAAHQISRGVLHGVARGAERLSVQAGARRGIRRCLCRKRSSVSRLRSAVRDQKGGNVPRIVIAQLEIGHRSRSRVGLRILQPGIDPLPGGLVGDVRE